MDERALRVGTNEALFRTVNEEVEDLNRTLLGSSDGTMSIVCECGDLGCVEQLTVAIPTYEKIRADSALFFIKPGHEKPDVEDVVEQNAEWAVVRKHPGDPERVAQATDPRS
jgi:hypothetical protein